MPRHGLDLSFHFIVFAMPRRPLVFAATGEAHLNHILQALLASVGGVPLLDRPHTCCNLELLLCITTNVLVDLLQRTASCVTRIGGHTDITVILH